MEERNFILGVASFLLTLTGFTQQLCHFYTAPTSRNLRLSIIFYKIMVKFETEKILGNFVLGTLIVGIWIQVERGESVEGWKW